LSATTIGHPFGSANLPRLTERRTAERPDPVSGPEGTKQTMPAAPLELDVHVAPMRPMKGAPPQGPGDDPMWSPMSSTLIHGEREGLLVDTLVTNDQVDALADWIDGFGIDLRAIYITHGHSDHWIGLARLRERFPKAIGLATPHVRERAAFEADDPTLAAYWQSIFPGEVPLDPVLPEVFEGDVIELEGRELRIGLGRGDTEFSTLLRVPEVEAVVAGDIVYNQVHMMVGESDSTARGLWIQTLDAIEATDPRLVVAGHKRVGAPDLPATIEESREYLRDFSRVADEEETVEGIVATMLALHPDRDNPRVVWHSARAEVARRASGGV
jgi:glyoxylase-like metal-dependent hydrolase (beta-lactamase superfamily II)